MLYITYAVAIIFIATGAVFLLARRIDGVKDSIEDIFLEGEDMFGKDRRYAPIIWWLGWPCVGLGMIILAPTNLIINLAAVSAIAYFIHKIRQADKKRIEEKVVNVTSVADDKKVS